MIYNEIESSFGSGAFISSNQSPNKSKFILTCAHNFMNKKFDRSEKGSYSSIVFRFGVSKKISQDEFQRKDIKKIYIHR